MTLPISKCVHRSSFRGRAIVLFSVCRNASEGRLSVSFQARIRYG